MRGRGRFVRFVGALVLVAVLVFAVWFFVTLKNGQQKFYLDEEYYGESSLVEIGAKDLKGLIEAGGSFGVFVYQPLCVVSDELAEVLAKFQAEHAIKFYRVPFTAMKTAGLAEEIKYYPSFAIYHEGRLVDFLEIDKGIDTDRYKSLEAFSEWVRGWVELDYYPAPAL